MLLQKMLLLLKMMLLLQMMLQMLQMMLHAAKNDVLLKMLFAREIMQNELDEYAE